MYLIIILLTVVLSVFSTGVMTYISLATPIGPWIAPTLVLMCSLIVRLFFWLRPAQKNLTIGMTTIGASVGGIVATAVGFSYPTLYFLDADLFDSWMAQPLYFVTILAALIVVAGGLGFVIATLFEEDFLVKQHMPFPIGQMVYKMISAQNQMRKSLELSAGFVSTMIFCALQESIFGFARIIPKTYTLVRSCALSFISIPTIVVPFDQLPMLWAIGFITGHVIVIPLLCGVLAKLLLADPIHVYFFASLTPGDFMMAFCSGIVLMSAITGFADLPAMILNSVKGIRTVRTSQRSLWQHVGEYLWRPDIIVSLLSIIAFLTYFSFSPLSQLYILVFTGIATYQIVAIAGKIGLALLGRFATWVMVPALLLFGLNAVQVTILATFVEIASGVATDIMFGRKVAELGEFPHKKVLLLQILGLVVSAIACGCILWILVKNLGLGSGALCAQRAQARALLINFTSFNYYVLAVGAVFGYILKYLKVNPMLVLGGLLMPLNYALGLIAGGLSTYLTKHRQEWEPFWSGVFAANSLWVLIRALL